MGSRTLFILSQIAIILITPPFFIGVINRVKALFAGRRGPPILQLYFDIFKLLRKGAVYSKSTSFLFKTAPSLILASVICAGMLLPITGAGPINFWGDAILFAYLFAFIRFITIVAALDTGSSFEGMGASREAAYGAFSELTVFVVIITLVAITRELSLTGIFKWSDRYFATDPSMIVLFLAFFFILLTENSRMPIDDPNTHLELTMIHEVMILDYSGYDLGVILYSASIKLFLFMVFAVQLIFPISSHNTWIGVGLMLLKVMSVAILIGIVESVTARVKLSRILQFLVASFVLSILALLTALFVRGTL